MQQKEFELTSIALEEVASKIDVVPLETILNSNLSLSDYGNAVKKIYFVFLAVKPEDTFYEDKVKFNKDSGTMELALKLSYPHVVKATPDRLEGMMATLFLRSIDLYEAPNVSDFDIERFKLDVGKLLL